jgi:RND family efflux transporter MFP subunit
MIFIIIIYVELLYLVFFKFRWLPWNKWTQYSSLFIGIVVLSAFMVGLRNTTPSSSQAAVTARVIEIAPQVSGRIDAVLAERSVEVEAGTVLYTIDPTAYAARVEDLEARLSLSRLRLDQFRELAEADAGSRFQLQQSEAEVRQLAAQLAGAQFDLDNTEVRAPAKGQVPRLFLKEGMQVSPGRAVITFLDTDEMMVGGLFPQHALRHIKIGDLATVNFPVLPGRIFESTVTIVPSAIGDSVFVASGQLPTTQGQRMVRNYPVYIALPDDFPDELKRVGMAAKVYIHTEKQSGIVGGVAGIMQQISASLDAVL